MRHQKNNFVIQTKLQDTVPHIFLSEKKRIYLQASVNMLKYLISNLQIIEQKTSRLKKEHVHCWKILSRPAGNKIYLSQYFSFATS